MYCKESDADHSFEMLNKEFSTIALPAVLADLFELTKNREETISVPNAEAIGQWLAKQQGDNRYFAETETASKRFTVKRAKNPFVSGLISQLAIGVKDEFVEVEEYRSVITGFRSTVKIPYNWISLLANPKYLNLELHECVVVPLVSRTSLRLFWGYRVWEYVNWDERRVVGQIEFQTSESLLKDDQAIKDMVEKISGGFFAFIQNTIDKRWPPELDMEDTDSGDIPLNSD